MATCSLLYPLFEVSRSAGGMGQPAQVGVSNIEPVIFRAGRAGAVLGFLREQNYALAGRYKKAVKTRQRQRSIHAIARGPLNGGPVL